MTQHDPQPPEDSDFDLRARAEMALAFEPGQAPAHLLRKPPRPWQRRGIQGIAAGLLLAAVGTGTLLVMRPAPLVRDAIEHEYHERMLRGSFMPAQPLAQHLGLAPTQALPGVPQLTRPCDIDGNIAYHLTTFFEKGGMVTVFAFDRPVRLAEGRGWWNSVHWQVVTSRAGNPLVLVAQQRKALAVAAASLLKPPA